MTKKGVPRGFVAVDVCRCLGIHIRSDGRINTNRALSKLTAPEKQNLPYKEAHLRGLKEVAARAYGVSLVSESGLYKLIMRSRKPEAKKFQNWVTQVVLPAIRKGYQTLR
ncbi:BRO family protein [Brucella sp. 10RB9214]|nr:BRO family protein [Brucella sp. 10RB9214]MRN49161.1 BRO family protein [Brucella sp. 10RB9214]